MKSDFVLVRSFLRKQVVLLSSSSQVGKMTLLEHIKKKDRSYVSFDDLNSRISAERDPSSFSERLELPLIIGRVQYAPSILPYI